MFSYSKAFNMANKVFPIFFANGSLNSKTVDMACEIVKKGGVIAVPTDTIYGLAGNADEPEVINRIYQIKSRSPTKPVGICVSKLGDIYKWSNVTVSHQILQSLLPGPFTLVFERSKNLREHINPNSNLIGIRIPDYPFMSLLCSKIQGPLVLTSANISEQESCNKVEQFSHIWSHLDAVFDAKTLDADTEKLGSTVIDFSQKGSFRIIRSGCALEQARQSLIHKFSLKEITDTDN